MVYILYLLQYWDTFLPQVWVWLGDFIDVRKGLWRWINGQSLYHFNPHMSFRSRLKSPNSKKLYENASCYWKSWFRVASIRIMQSSRHQVSFRSVNHSRFRSSSHRRGWWILPLAVAGCPWWRNDGWEIVFPLPCKRWVCGVWVLIFRVGCHCSTGCVVYCWRTPGMKGASVRMISWCQATVISNR